MESFASVLRTWNKQHSSFTKLQHAYAAITILAFITAGLIGLLNYRLGQSILFVAMCSLLIFIANGVVWALVKTFLMPAEKKSASSRKRNP